MSETAFQHMPNPNMAAVPSFYGATVPTVAVPFETPAAEEVKYFTFRIGERVLKMPMAGYLTTGQLATFSDPEQVFTGLLGMFTGEDREAVASLQASQATAVLSAWQEASQVTLGESQASAS